MDDVRGNHQVVEEILSLAEMLFRQLLPTVPKEVLSLDIPMGQMKILFLLYMKGTMRISDIAASLDISLPATSNLVERLVERGHVLREGSSEDRRVVICRLTEVGALTVGNIWHSARIRCHDLLHEMTADKLQQLAESLRAMYEVALIEHTGGRGREQDVGTAERT